MIAYKLWYVAVDGIHWIQLLTEVFRSHRRFNVNTLLGLSRRKSPVQTTLILLVESGLVYLIFQVSDCRTLRADICVQDPQSFHLSDR